VPSNAYTDMRFLSCVWEMHYELHGAALTVHASSLIKRICPNQP
jgi:hypothetical protein